MKVIKQALIMFSLLTILVCGIYPMAVMGLSRVIFSDQASGTMITHKGSPVGSELIAQEFTSQKYFWSRPSAAGFNASASGATNYALTNSDYQKLVKERSASGLDFDLLTASASGLDPHISPKAAMIQVERVARARGISNEAVIKLVQENTQTRQLGFLGEDRVNVLMLNIGLETIVHE